MTEKGKTNKIGFIIVLKKAKIIAEKNAAKNPLTSTEAKR